jgi:hypothetical protein
MFQYGKFINDSIELKLKIPHTTLLNDSIHISLNPHSRWKSVGRKTEGEMQCFYAKVLCSRVTACGICIEDLDIAKALENMHIQAFFLLT